MKTIAIIPARGGSKRLPDKNIRPFLGIPLIEWTIKFALKYQGFDKVVVSTDCEQIAAVSRGAGIEPYMRPARLATDDATSVDVAIDALSDYDLVALLQPTSPIRDRAHWDLAFDLIRNHDAVVGVTRGNKHPFRNGLSLTGSLYLIRADVLKRERTFCPADTAAIMCSHPIDIDTLDEFIAAETMVRQKAYISVFGEGTP